MADVFISYKTERKAAAEHLATILGLYGYSVWLDRRGLTGGDRYTEEIEREIRKAQVVVSLVCSLTSGSEWMKKETRLASSLKRLVPIRIENVSEVDLSLDYQGMHFIDLWQWSGHPASDKVLTAIHHVGVKVGRAPRLDAAKLEAYEKVWESQGRPSLQELLTEREEAPPSAAWKTRLGGALETTLRPPERASSPPPASRGPYEVRFVRGLNRSYTIGRTPDNDYPIAHSQVSARHCFLHVVDGQLSIEDRGSANGTYVRGRRIEPEERTLLHEDEKIFVGPCPVTIAPGTFAARLAGADGSFVVYSGGPVRIGRDPARCALVLTDSRTSAVHASLTLAGGALFAMDEGSTHGTFINGVRLPTGATMEVPEGGKLRLGPVEFSVQIEIV